MIDHTDVHEFLRRMADETGLSSVDPAPIMRKARRRLTRTTVICFLVTIVLVAGALAGASTLTRSTIPAKQTLKNNGVISFIGDDEIDAIEPDGTGRRLLTSDLTSARLEIQAARSTNKSGPRTGRRSHSRLGTWAVTEGASPTSM